MGLRRVLANPGVRVRMRAYLVRRCGVAAVDFLYSYWTFTESTNPLVRFEQLRGIMHRPPIAGDVEGASVSRDVRERLALDWEEWSGGHRVPADAELPGLHAAAREVEAVVMSRSALAGLPDRQTAPLQEEAEVS